MAIYLNLNQARSFARTVIRERGGDTVVKRPDGSAGCYNVICFNADGGYISAHLLDTELGVEKYGDLVAEVKPLCLVGSIFIEAGIKAEDILKAGHAGTNVSGMMYWQDDEGRQQIELTSYAKRWLSEVQRKQDNGKTWDEAYASADKQILDRIAEDNTIL